MGNTDWIVKHCQSLQGKTVAITGATGGLGREICRGILALGGGLILLSRNGQKTQALTKALKAEYPQAQIALLPLELTDLNALESAAQALNKLEPDILVHNAGAYKIPRRTCAPGLDNVFTINFAAPYYLTWELLPMLSRNRGKVVVMGSVAHTYSPTDPHDIDFSTRTHCHLVYGNSKRYLMFGFARLLDQWPQVDFAIAHPGITVTNITAHYPKALYALIRYPMKLIFPRPGRAARSMVMAIGSPIPRGCWIGPRFFGVWGNPAVKALNTCPEAEQQAIQKASESVYQALKEAVSPH